MPHAICNIAKQYRFAIRHIKNNRDSYTDATWYRISQYRSNSYCMRYGRNVAWRNTAWKFYHFRCILAHFWFFSASERVIICDYKHLESLFTLIKVVNEVQKQWGEIFEEVEWRFEKDTLLKKKKKKK